MLSHLFTIAGEFFRDLRAQKLRVFLTTFGIIWGTVAVIVLVAFGLGMKKQTMKNMHGIGEGVAIMFPGRTTKAFEGYGTGRRISFLEDDAALIKAQLSEIEVAIPEYILMGVPARFRERVTTPGITGVYPPYEHLRNVIPELGGRFINDYDVAQRRRVVVLGDDVKRQLFGESDAVGKTIFVGQTPFTIIGVMTEKVQNSSYFTRDQNRIFMPATTFSALFGTVNPTVILYKSVDPTRYEETEKEVRAVLSRRLRFDPTDEDAVWIWSTGAFDKFMFYFFLAFNIFLGVIGGFTLGVAGVGVANIMFIVVQERVQEIGIKRALGARRSNIMLQFFTETFFIIGLGASVGFAISAGLIAALQYIPIKEYIGTPQLSVDVALITMTILAFVGLAAGMMPARRAANLEVVECLRT